MAAPSNPNAQALLSRFIRPHWEYLHGCCAAFGERERMAFVQHPAPANEESMLRARDPQRSQRLATFVRGAADVFILRFAQPGDSTGELAGVSAADLHWVVVHWLILELTTPERRGITQDPAKEAGGGSKSQLPYDLEPLRLLTAEHWSFLHAQLMQCNFYSGFMTSSSSLDLRAKQQWLSNFADATVTNFRVRFAHDLNAVTGTTMQQWHEVLKYCFLQASIGQMNLPAPFDTPIAYTSPQEQAQHSITALLHSPTCDIQQLAGAIDGTLLAIPYSRPRTLRMAYQGLHAAVALDPNSAGRMVDTFTTGILTLCFAPAFAVERGGNTFYATPQAKIELMRQAFAEECFLLSDPVAWKNGLVFTHTDPISQRPQEKSFSPAECLLLHGRVHGCAITHGFLSLDLPFPLRPCTYGEKADACVWVILRSTVEECLLYGACLLVALIMTRRLRKEEGADRYDVVYREYVRRCNTLPESQPRDWVMRSLASIASNINIISQHSDVPQVASVQAGAGEQPASLNGEIGATSLPHSASVLMLELVPANVPLASLAETRDDESFGLPAEFTSPTTTTSHPEELCGGVLHSQNGLDISLLDQSGPRLLANTASHSLTNVSPTNTVPDDFAETQAALPPSPCPSIPQSSVENNLFFSMPLRPLSCPIITGLELDEDDIALNERMASEAGNDLFPIDTDSDKEDSTASPDTMDAIATPPSSHSPQPQSEPDEPRHMFNNKRRLHSEPTILNPNSDAGTTNSLGLELDIALPERSLSYPTAQQRSKRRRSASPPADLLRLEASGEVAGNVRLAKWARMTPLVTEPRVVELTNSELSSSAAEATPLPPQSIAPRPNVVHIASEPPSSLAQPTFSGSEPAATQRDLDTKDEMESRAVTLGATASVVDLEFIDYSSRVEPSAQQTSSTVPESIQSGPPSPALACTEPVVRLSAPSISQGRVISPRASPVFSAMSLESSPASITETQEEKEDATADPYARPFSATHLRYAFGYGPDLRFCHFCVMDRPLDENDDDVPEGKYFFPLDSCSECLAQHLLTDHLYQAKLLHALDESRIQELLSSLSLSSGAS